MLTNLKSMILVLICLHALNPDYSIQMSKIKMLTLNHGKMTNSIRVPAIPQLKCVGETASCRAFIPQVVQCENQGSDGITIQWECKTDMGNVYRHGEIMVICEGYDYPGDQYVLVGSCGLEYNINLTKEGIDHPPISIIHIGPPPPTSSWTIFFICLGILLVAQVVTAIFVCFADIFDVRVALKLFLLVTLELVVFSVRSSSYHEHWDVPFARLSSSSGSMELKLPRDLE